MAQGSLPNGAADAGPRGVETVVLVLIFGLRGAYRINPRPDPCASPVSRLYSSTETLTETRIIGWRHRLQRLKFRRYHIRRFIVWFFVRAE